MQAELYSVLPGKAAQVSTDRGISGRVVEELVQHVLQTGDPRERTTGENTSHDEIVHMSYWKTQTYSRRAQRETSGFLKCTKGVGPLCTLPDGRDKNC